MKKALEVKKSGSELSDNWLDFLWIELTNSCNLHCAHCYSNSSPKEPISEEMTLESWKLLLNDARRLNCEAVQFIGGEPTLSPFFIDLVNHAKEIGFTFIEVFTNATRLNDKTVNCLQENGVKVATSFYSNQPRVHEIITTQSGSFQKTVNGIKRVLAAELDLRVELIALEENVNDISHAIELLKSIGVKNFASHREQSVGRSEKKEKSSKHGDICGQCWKGRLAVNAKGNCHPCIMSSSCTVGNVVENSLENIINSQNLKTFRSDVRKEFSRPEVLPEIFRNFDLEERLRMGCSPGGWNEACGPGFNLGGLDCAPSGIGDGCGPMACGPLFMGTCGPENCAPFDCPPTGVVCGPHNCAPYDVFDTCGPQNCAPFDCSPTGVICGPHNCSPNDVSGTCGPQNCAPFDCPPTGVVCGPHNCAPYD